MLESLTLDDGKGEAISEEQAQMNTDVCYCLSELCGIIGHAAFDACK